MYQQQCSAAQYLSRLSKLKSSTIPAIHLLLAVENQMRAPCNVDLLSTSFHRDSKSTVVDFMLSQLPRGLPGKIGRLSYLMLVGMPGEHLFRHLVFADTGNLFGVLEFQEFWSGNAKMATTVRDASWSGTAHLFGSAEQASCYWRERGSEWDLAAEVMRKGEDCLVDA